MVKTMRLDGSQLPEFAGRKDDVMTQLTASATLVMVPAGRRYFIGRLRRVDDVQPALRRRTVFTLTVVYRALSG